MANWRPNQGQWRPRQDGGWKPGQGDFVPPRGWRPGDDPPPPDDPDMLARIAESLAALGVELDGRAAGKNLLVAVGQALVEELMRQEDEDADRKAQEDDGS